MGTSTAIEKCISTSVEDKQLKLKGKILLPKVCTWTWDVIWTYIGRSEDILDAFWTSYASLIYIMCPGGNIFNV